MFGSSPHLWSIVLAGGDGTRLNGFSRDRLGQASPKQYATFLAGSTLRDGRSMFSLAMDRAAALTSEERTVAVVAEQHREWWTRELAARAEAQLSMQPANRGTAPGILLPLLEVCARDPDAMLAFLPSDHYVEDEERMQQAIGRAVRCARTAGRIVMLGVRPDGPECDYGWIVPGRRERNGARAVALFSEKPDPLRAVQLRSLGGLWSTFIFVAGAASLLEIFATAQPRLLWRFVRAFSGGDPDGTGLQDLYDELPERDFSRDVLQRVPSRVSVLPVASCGWTDLGTPARLARWQAREPEYAPAAVAAQLVPAGMA